MSLLHLDSVWTEALQGVIHQTVYGSGNNEDKLLIWTSPMCWKWLQAETQYCRYPVMAVKPHGSQQSAQAAVYLVDWSKQWSMSAFGLCPLKNCPLEEDMMMSCGWFAWGNSHFTHLILNKIFKRVDDIDVKCILCMFDFVCRWAQGKTAGLCVGNKHSASRIH